MAQKPTENDAFDLMDVAAAAELLGVHPETVRRLAREGTLPALKLAGSYVFPRPVLQQQAAGERRVCAHCRQQQPPPDFVDAGGRYWHVACIRRRLANGEAPQRPAASLLALPCPRCGSEESDVDLTGRQGEEVRRRRKCTACGHFYETYEHGASLAQLQEVERSRRLIQLAEDALPVTEPQQQKGQAPACVHCAGRDPIPEVSDAAGRPWHASCAYRLLSYYALAVEARRLGRRVAFVRNGQVVATF